MLDHDRCLDCYMTHPNKWKGVLYGEVQKLFNLAWKDGVCWCPLYGKPYSMRDRLPITADHPSDCLSPQGALMIHTKEEV